MLDPSLIGLVGPVEIDEFYVSAGKKGRERDQESRSRGLSKRGRGSYDQDKPPVFVLADRGSGQRYVIPSKSADESTVRLLLDDHEVESLTVYTDGFRAYDPLEADERYERDAVIHGEGEYVDGDAHVNTCESRIKEFLRTNLSSISDSSNFAGESYTTRTRSPEKHVRSIL